MVSVPTSGAGGCRNADVGAFATFLGVKCCCKVEKAARGFFLGSSFGGSRDFADAGRAVCSGSSPTRVPAAEAEESGTSGLARTSAARFNAVNRVSLAVPLAVASVEALLGIFPAPLGGTRSDFGLSWGTLRSVEASRLPATVLVDCVRACERVLAGCATCVGAAGLRSDCVRLRGNDRDEADLFGILGGGIVRAAVTPSASGRSSPLAEVGWYMARGLSRPCFALGRPVSRDDMGALLLATLLSESEDAFLSPACGLAASVLETYFRSPGWGRKLRLFVESVVLECDDTGSKGRVKGRATSLSPESSGGGVWEDCFGLIDAI